MADEPKRKTGRPEKTLTAAEKKLASYMYIAGHTKEQIAKTFGMSDDTLRKLHPLEDEKRRIDGMVAGTLIGAIKKGCITSTIFYLKTRCGWRDKMPEDQVEDAVRRVLAPIATFEEWRKEAQKHIKPSLREPKDARAPRKPKK